jgi:hypothetical protein
MLPRALAIIAAGTYTDADVYVKGKISQLGEFGASYGNYTYFISDDGTAPGPSLKSFAAIISEA